MDFSTKRDNRICADLCASKINSVEDVKRNKQVLVTGGTGLVGVHCILQLLKYEMESRSNEEALLATAESLMHFNLK